MNIISILGNTNTVGLQAFFQRKAQQHNLLLIDLVDDKKDIWLSDVSTILQDIEEKLESTNSSESFLSFLIELEKQSDEPETYLHYWDILTNFEYTWVWGLMGR